MKYTSRSMRRRRDTDQWEVTLSHKDPITGETVRTFHTVKGKTKKQAETAKRELILDLERRGGAAGSNMTVREFMDSFLDYKVKSGTIEPATVRGYRAEARQIGRWLGDVRLSDLSIPQVNDWMHDMTEAGYAPKSCAKAFRLLKQALKYAMAIDLLTKNPCDFCKPPKRVKTPINALDRAERTRMLRYAREAVGTPLALAVELALTTGMRRGEVCALRWSDLGDDGTISVRRALGCGEGGFYVKAPKTAGSERTIPLTKYTHARLSALKRASAERAREMGVPFGDPYILGTQEPDSRPYNPTQLGKDFSAFCKMHGFQCTFHDLRHTFATMMIAGGCDVRTVASYLGHSSVTMTLETYADVDPDAKVAAVSKVEESFDEAFGWPEPLPDQPKAAAPAPVPAITFTAAQLRAMLAEAERKEAAGA